jgi:hypothetical protein
MAEICSGFVMPRTQAPEIAGFVMGIAASAHRGWCGVIKHDPEKWMPVFGKSCFKQQHDPKKWMPVFGKDHASSNSMIPKSGCRFSGKIMLQATS